ncbi:YcnI family protein [Jatrophihabitans telluris]|uniref:YcnI family protein n=1 Tax=Jatrophihabitans telluris TaxID=2038343 RepID=A0ABY4QX06_9ACTN|nr:YcnI family protein [Jatrophihabitans telluris]UQX87657.1 YcnI family protein [Jatrophihabitans telluris]
MKLTRRAGAVGLASAAVLGLGLLTAAPALAHVTVSAANAVQGGYSTITFQVPTESAAANTVAVAVQLPLDTPIASVSVQPKPGWTYTEKTAKPSTPLSSDGGAVTSIVTEIDWKVAAGARGIAPGQFDTFVISAGPLPETSTLTFKVVQKYSDGSTVSWIELPAPGSTTEPDHPAPAVSLAPAAATSGTAGSGSSPSVSASGSGGGSESASAESGADSSNTVAEVALLIGIIALLAAAGALALLVSIRRSVRAGASSR